MRQFSVYATVEDSGTVAGISMSFHMEAKDVQEALSKAKQIVGDGDVYHIEEVVNEPEGTAES